MKLEETTPLLKVIKTFVLDIEVPPKVVIDFNCTVCVVMSHSVGVFKRFPRF